MGDARKYPEIRALRYQYATLFLPRDLRNDAEYRKQWVDNNLTYLDAVLLERYLNEKKLVRLKKPRLPSALGLSGACGVEA
eukprot:scaffold2150_cov137-Isochrysis_galbana.AAC.14